MIMDKIIDTLQSNKVENRIMSYLNVKIFVVLTTGIIGIVLELTILYLLIMKKLFCIE